MSFLAPLGPISSFKSILLTFSLLGTKEGHELSKICINCRD